MAEDVRSTIAVCKGGARTAWRAENGDCAKALPFLLAA
jgi:hypothetical protein